MLLRSLVDILPELVIPGGGDPWSHASSLDRRPSLVLAPPLLFGLKSSMECFLLGFDELGLEGDGKEGSCSAFPSKSLIEETRCSAKIVEVTEPGRFE